MNERTAHANGNGASHGGMPAVVSADAAPLYARQPGYPSIVMDSTPYGEVEGRINYLDYLRVIVKRRWLVVGVLSVCLAFALYRSLTETPLYQATATVQIERQVATTVKGESVNTDIWDWEFLQTQLELLKSRALAQKVVARLNLIEDFNFAGKDVSGLAKLRKQLSDQLSKLLPLGELRNLFSRKSVTGDSKDNAEPADGQSLAKQERSAVGIIMGGTVVQPIKDSRVVRVSYIGVSPDHVAKFANAITDAFIASNLERRAEASGYAQTFLDDKLKEKKLALEDAEKSLVDFAQQEQIVDLGERSSLVESNLNAANAALTAATAERIRSEELGRQAERDTGNALPQMLTSELIATLRQKRVELAAEYQEKASIYQPAYPLLVQMKQQLGEIDRQIAAETKRIKESLRATNESSRNVEETFQKQVKALESELLDLQKRSIRYTILKRQVDTHRTMYEALLQRYGEVGLADVGANNISIVDRAETGSQISPNIKRALTLALLAGLFLGVLGAFVLEFLDDTIKTPDDMERVLGTATLGIIPKSTPAKIRSQLTDPRSAISESYRSLCTALQFSTASGIPKTLVVTSCRPSEGKSTTTLTLAKQHVAMGLQVLIVDADLRNPSLHRSLKIENTVGLSNYLAGGCKAEDALQATGIQNLILMTSGPLPPNPAELLAGPKLQSLLSFGSEEFDLVIIDAPPVLGLADAPLLASAAAGTLIVVAASQTRTAPMRIALKRLKFARAYIVGAVLNKFDSKNVGYGYSYSYGYADRDYYAYGAKPARIARSSKS